MKYVITFLFLYSFPVFGDVSGTWAYSGSGCRDNQLSPESHRSKAPNFDNPISEAIFTFKRDGTVTMNAVFENGEKQNEKSSYRLRGNNLTFPEWPDAIIKVINNRIIIGDTEEENSPCRRGEVFVYILSSVD